MSSGRWPQTFEDRLWSKVDKGAGCWLWTASLSSTGYGRFFVDGKTRQASRVVYEVAVGPIPDGLELDHLCRNTTCVRPSHLEPVTHAENVLRGARRAATHCVNGHEFTPDNTTPRPRRDSVQRRCKACERYWQAGHRQRVAARLADRKAS